MDALALLFTLVIGHAIADFVLQPAPMSRGKNRRSKLQSEYGDNFPPWYYWMSAHALTHAGFVLLITGSVLFAVIETITHALIDFGKCERYYNLHVDQLLHTGIKCLYCVLVHYGIS
jgi:hypothetical protein